jgi:hypothetical protein
MFFTSRVPFKPVELLSRGSGFQPRFRGLREGIHRGWKPLPQGQSLTAGGEAQVQPPVFAESDLYVVVHISRLLKNKHQAVSQGVRRFGKRSIAVAM